MATRSSIPQPPVSEQAVRGVERYLSGMANLYMVSNPDDSWVLIDAGMPLTGNRILRWIERHKGASAKPHCILLTHGHFDHVGAVRKLAQRWNVPVYAHRTEKPYLNGSAKYPPCDPTVGKGAFSLLAPLYPRGPINISEHLRELPENGSVPGLPDWQWVPTPGHSPGHVSFFRPSDRVLIAGDAFATTKQESVSAVMRQKVELHGPPAYFTIDWDAARESVARLAALRPRVVACGHGTPLAGPQTAAALEELAAHFDQVERPAQGRYVRQPAIINDSGVVSVPPPVIKPVVKVAVGIAITAGIISALALAFG